jgi:hypothetical protein
MASPMPSFDDLDEYYPGSRRKRRESREARQERLTLERAEAKADGSWDARPWRRHVRFPDGREVDLELFPTGSPAKALQRDSGTIRRWIRKGWLPNARYKTPAVTGSRGDAGRRLWSRAQIEGISRIAEEEGLLTETPARIQRTNFTRRVIAGWKEWL